MLNKLLAAANASIPMPTISLKNGGSIFGPRDPIEDEMKVLYKKNLSYDNKPAFEVARSAAKKMGINPSLLISSSFQEGMNKAIAKPDEVSEAYTNAKVEREFPVDGFYNYGLDTFGDKYGRLKAGLPKDFEQNVRFYPAENEKKEKVMTAAFKNNESALIAKAAMLKDSMNTIVSYAKSKGEKLDENATNYFTMAAYNTGEPNAQKMLDKYLVAKDKAAYLEKGDASWQKVHKNILPRMKKMALATQLLNEK